MAAPTGTCPPHQLPQSSVDALWKALGKIQLGGTQKTGGKSGVHRGLPATKYALVAGWRGMGTQEAFGFCPKDCHQLCDLVTATSFL